LELEGDRNELLETENAAMTQEVSVRILKFMHGRIYKNREKCWSEV